MSYTAFADPYLTCDQCHGWITGVTNLYEGDGPTLTVPCEHRAGSTSACPSWSPVNGCSCAAVFGSVPHGEPPR